MVSENGSTDENLAILVQSALSRFATVLHQVTEGDTHMLVAESVAGLLWKVKHTRDNAFGKFDPSKLHLSRAIWCWSGQELPLVRISDNIPTTAIFGDLDDRTARPLGHPIYYSPVTDVAEVSEYDFQMLN